MQGKEITIIANKIKELGVCHLAAFILRANMPLTSVAQNALYFFQPLGMLVINKTSYSLITDLFSSRENVMKLIELLEDSDATC